MDIDATFLPVARTLIDDVFNTSVTYHRMNGQTYDPATGELVNDVQDYSISAGVLSRSRTDEGGAGEDYSLELWIQHSASGVPHLPTTSDEVTYDGVRWKVSSVSPTYSSKALIASKLLCHA